MQFKRIEKDLAAEESARKELEHLLTLEMAESAQVCAAFLTFANAAAADFSKRLQQLCHKVTLCAI